VQNEGSDVGKYTPMNNKYKPIATTAIINNNFFRVARGSVFFKKYFNISPYPLFISLLQVKPP
jgi:hypothetical protein